MLAWESSIFINHPQQEVWDLISDPAKFAQWQGSAESAEWTSEGPPGVSSTFRGVAKFLGRKIEHTSEITIWGPPNHVGLNQLSGLMPLESTTKLEPRENGTQLNLRAQMEIGGIFKMAEGLVGKQAEKQTYADLEALKLLLEKGQE